MPRKPKEEIHSEVQQTPEGVAPEPIRTRLEELIEIVRSNQPDSPESEVRKEALGLLIQEAAEQAVQKLRDLLDAPSSAVQAAKALIDLADVKPPKAKNPEENAITLTVRSALDRPAET